MKNKLKRMSTTFTALMLGLLPALAYYSPVKAQANFVLHKVSGTVVDNSGAPVQGATVSIDRPVFEYAQHFQFSPSSGGWSSEDMATSSVDGTFTISNVFSGTYDLTVMPPYGTSLKPYKVNSLVVSNDINLGNIALTAGARHISGIVTDSYGNPIVNGLVRWHSSAGNPTYYFLTDANGNYQINVEPGVYNKVDVRTNVYEGGPFAGGPYQEAYITDSSANVDTTGGDAVQNLQVAVGRVKISTTGSYNHVTIQPADPGDARTSLLGGQQTANIDYERSVQLDEEADSSGNIDTTLIPGIRYLVCVHYYTAVVAACSSLTPVAGTTTSLSLIGQSGSGGPTGLISSGTPYSLGWTIPVSNGLYATNQQPTISWNAEASAVGYRIYRDGIKIGDSTTTSYTDSAVQSGERYIYSVRSVDANGQESPSYSQIVVAYDTAAPTVKVTMDSDSLTPTTLGRIYASVTDNMANLKRIEYFIDNDPGQGNGAELSRFGETTTAVGGIDPTSLAAGSHTIYLRAEDVGGNWSNLAAYTFNFTLPPNTNAGSNVTVPLTNGVTLTFDNVTTAGDTSISTTTAPPTPPQGFKYGNPPTYYNISTTADYSGNITVCFSYDPAAINVPEANLRLLHFHDNGWTDITSSVDTDNNIICGITTNFSGFGILQEPDFQGLIDTVKAMNLQQGIENSLDAKLQNALDAVSADKNHDFLSVSNDLQAALNEIDAQRGGKLTDQQADTLTNMTNELLSYF